MIDITNLVESLRSTFVTWSVNFVFASTIALPGFSWLGLPILSSLYKGALSWVLNLISNSAVLEAFFLNTAIRKASQASDYISAVDFKKSLPENVSDDDYEKAELKEIDAFKQFVSIVT